MKAYSNLLKTASLVLVVFTVFLSGAFAQQTITVKHSKGETVVPKNPKKVVVAMHMNGRFNPSGPNSRFGFAYDVLGLKPAYIPAPIAESTLQEGQQRKRPQAPKLSEINPDYLFIFDRNTGIKGIMPEESDIFTEDVKGTAAYKTNKAFILPGWIWYLSGSGLISVDQKITDIGEKLYGIKF